jgi:hypothetical protein
VAYLNILLECEESSLVARSLNSLDLSSDTIDTIPLGQHNRIAEYPKTFRFVHQTEPGPKTIASSIWLYLLVLLIAAISLYFSEFRLFCTPIVVATDQWINIHGALRMANGERIYADFFQYTWPGTEVVYAGLIKLFGASPLLFCTIPILLGIVSVGLGICLSQRILPGNAAVLPALLYLAFARVGFDATHHKFSILLVIAATAILLSGEKLGHLAATGALIELASFFTQTRVICLFAIATFMLHRAHESQLSWRRIVAQQSTLIVSFALVVGVLLWRFVEPIGFGRFIELTVSFPLHYYRTGDHNNWNFYLRMPPIGSGVFAYWLIMNTLIPGIYLVFFLIWWQCRSTDPAQPWDPLMLIGLVGLFLFFSIGYAPILSRLCEVSLPAIVLGVWIVRRLGRKSISSAGIWTVAIVGILALAIRTQTRTSLIVSAPSGKVAVIIPDNSSKSMAAAEWMATHTKPGEVVFVADDPTLYTVLGLTNPTELPFVTATPYTRPEQIAQAVAAMAKREPKYILWNDSLDPRGDTPEGALSPLRRLLRERFIPIKEFANGERVFARSAS